MVMQAAQSFGRFVDSIQRNASRFNDPTDQPPEFYASLEENQRQAEIKPSVRDREEIEKLIPIAGDFRNRGKNKEEGQKAIQRLAEIPGGTQTLDRVASSAISQNVRIMQGEAPENVGQQIRRDIGQVGKDIITPMVSAEQVERILPTVSQQLQPVVDALGTIRTGVERFGPTQASLASRILPESRQETAQFVSEQTTPLGLGLTVGTAGAGGAVPTAALTRGIAAAPRGISTGLRAVRAITQPIGETASGFRGFAQRAAQEQAAETGAVLGSEFAERQTAGLPAPIRTAAQIGAGLLGGVGGLATAPVIAGRRYARPDVTINTARDGNIEDVFPSSELAKPDTTIKEIQQTANQPDLSPPSKNILGEDEQYRKPLDKTPDVDLDNLQDFDQKLDINFSDNGARRLGTRLKRFTGLFNPALRAINEGKRYAINYASQIDEIKNKLNAIFIPVDALGSPLRIFGAKGYDQQYRFTDGAFQGKTVNEIVENPSAFDLNETQIEYIQKLNTIDKAATKKAIALGKDITLLDESQQMYAFRKIIARIDPDTGKPVDVRNLSDVDEKAGQIDTDIDVDELLKGENVELKTQPFIPTGVEAAKRRQLKDTKDALDNGYVVLPYDQAVKAKVEQVYKLEAAKNLEDAVNKYIKQGDPSGSTVAVKFSTIEEQSKAFDDAITKSAEESRDFLDQLKSGLTDYQRTASSVWRKNKFLKGLGNINVLGRSLELAFDASLFGIQLSSVLARDLIGNTLKGQRPTIAPATVKNFRKTFWNGLSDPQKAADFGARYLADNVDVIREMDKVELYTTRNIAEFLEGAAAVRNATTFKDVEFSFIGKVGGGLKGAYGRAAAPFQEAWTATMNTAKIEMYKNMRHYFTDANGNIIDLARKAEVEDHINNVTGTVSSSRLGVSPLQRNIENILLLAPRYTRATVGLLIDAAQGGLPLFRQRGIRGPGGQRIPLVTTGTSGSLRGKLAQEAIASNLAIFALLGTAYITAQTLIEDGDKPNRKEIWEKKIKDFYNPTTGKFFMIQAGENLLGAGGKVISLTKITSKILNKTVKAVGDAGGIGEDDDIGIDDPEAIVSIKNDILRFLRGNTSHAIGLGVDTILGEEYMGRRVLGIGNRDTDDTFGQIAINTLANLGTTLVPIWIQSSAFESGSFWNRGIRGLAEGFGERAYEETKNVRRDKIAQASPYNVTSWNDLDAQQKDALTKRLSEEDRRFLIEKEEEDIARGNKFARYRDEKERLEDDLQEYSEDYLQIFKENIRAANYNSGDIYNELRAFARRVSDQEIRTYAQIESLRDKYGIEGFSGQEVESEFDKILNRYYGLYDKYSRTKTVDGVTTVIPGTVDYDQYNLAKESLKATISPANRAKLEIYLNRKEINQQAQAILQLRQPISTDPLRFRNRNQVRAEVFSILNIR